MILPNEFATRAQYKDVEESLIQVFFFLGTCEKRITAQWRLPKKNVFRPQEKSKFGIAERFSFCKYSNSAQTKISVCSIF